MEPVQNRRFRYSHVGKNRAQTRATVGESSHLGGVGDRPEIRGIMTIGIGPVGYVAGWGLTDGMDVVFGWDGD